MTVALAPRIPHIKSLSSAALAEPKAMALPSTMALANITFTKSTSCLSCLHQFTEYCQSTLLELHTTSIDKATHEAPLILGCDDAL